MKRLLLPLLLLVSCCLAPSARAATSNLATAPQRAAQATSVKVTVLSTMLADEYGVGEWGFAALVEVDGYRVLFDTGARPETVLHNAEELKIDLSQVVDVVLSHNHDDHTGGLLTLRQALRAKNPHALSRAHVAEGIFAPRRYDLWPTESNPMPALREKYEATGATMIVHKSAEMIAPGVWITGPVPRPFPEHNWPKGMWIVTPHGEIPDTIPEDMSMLVSTKDGLVVVTGCGHAGIGNILAKSREMVPHTQVRAVIGGLHLLDADEKTLAWTADQMRQAGVAYLLGAHCTGIEAVYRLRALLNLDRKTAVVAAVGSSYSSKSGIDPLWLAH